METEMEMTSPFTTRLEEHLEIGRGEADEEWTR